MKTMSVEEKDKIVHSANNILITDANDCGKYSTSLMRLWGAINHYIQYLEDDIDWEDLADLCFSYKQFLSVARGEYVRKADVLKQFDIMTKNGVVDKIKKNIDALPSTEGE